MTHRAAEDVDLLRRYLAGDVAAFDELMAAHEDRVFGICLRMLRDRDAALDAVQETFLTVAQFAELHKDIIDQFGRFPHRNKLLGRKNTPEEDEYLANDSPDFGQGS